jgi:hypothetical protein
MIADLSSLATLQSEWQVAIHMRERMRHLAVSTFALNALTSPAFGDILYNLPFRLAFEVLKQVLLQARQEGLFTSKGYQLGDLMDSAKASLSWNNWQALRGAVRRRNEVVHGGKLYGDEQCLQDMADIEAQLIAWRIITSP